VRWEGMGERRFWERRVSSVTGRRDTLGWLWCQTYSWQWSMREQ